jgi:hypothetical protein
VSFAAAALLCALSWIVACPRSAQAYCRESLEAQSQGACIDDPNAVDLFWNRGCLTQTFNNAFFSRLSPNLTETEARAAFNASFKSWADVPCGTSPPFLVVQASGVTATSTSKFLYDVPNESIVVLRTQTEWTNMPDHDSNAIALTLLWHDKHTGEILDVDMELNGGAGKFADCEQQQCGNNNVDLQNTITHEAGHLLGLAHSTVPGSTMQASTSSSPEITKRLEADDKAGYCALDLPVGPCSGASCVCPAPPIFPSKTTTSSCGCRVPGAVSDASRGALASELAGIALASAWMRRRRRQQQSG